MLTLSEIRIYPIKSCGGISLAQADIGPLGLALDRHWMVVDADGQFLTQRSHARLATVAVQLEDGALCLAAPGMASLQLDAAGEDGARRQVQVWKHSVAALDQGPRAARWLSELLQTDAGLVRFDPGVERVCSERWTTPQRATTQFSDGYPLLVTSQDSLDELNGRMQAKGAPALPMERFRPNLVISGLEAYEEDFIDTLQIGAAPQAVQLRMVKPCARCPVPGIDQRTGLRDAQWPHEPLDTLASYRANPRVDGGLTFGQNAIVIGGLGQTLRVGQACSFEIAF